MKNIQQKVLKNGEIVKFQKCKDLEQLYPNCEPDRYNAQGSHLFSDMSFAIAAIIERTFT